MYFQQDGVSAYNAGVVRECLDGHFRIQRLGRNSPFEL
jgi:hypothetical protein